MKYKVLYALLPLFLGSTVLAQTNQPPADAEPASSNVPGSQFPKIDSERRAYFRIVAPDAKSVSVGLPGGREMTKGADGIWTVTTAPLAPGFHYYQITVDGVSASDPASESYFGTGKMSSGIEVPSPGEDFYLPKDVPHGDVRAHNYFSKTTGKFRRCFVYTPPGYDTNLTARYPVLYLQHGMGEDATSWPRQGRVGFILDNLIAEGKAKPMIVVMADGNITPGSMSGPGRGGFRGRGGRGGFGGRRGGTPGQVGAQAANTNNPPGTAGFRGRRGRGGPGGGGGGQFWDAFGPVLINDIIPMIDSTYRTIPDRDHRAMAGLSLGGTQTWEITQAHLDMFAYIGSFSAPFGYPQVPDGYNGLLGDPAAFARQVKVLFVSYGTAGDLAAGGSRAFHEALEKAGIKHVYYESPGTAHEWQTWRRSLHEFAPLLFRN
ncbi:MAG TPA: alpha/beta hydrolase-fold protein [Verrucomicrobiae bacterium]|nr:alpha/beta hydrolase-fold protein [Verrucomicrobiae bacterium]